MIKRLNRPRSFGPTTKLSSFLRTFSLSPLLCLMIIYPTKRHWNWNALTLIFHFKSLQCEKLLQHFFWTAWLALYWQHSPVSPPLAAQTLWNGSSLSGECELWTIIYKVKTEWVPPGSLTGHLTTTLLLSWLLLVDTSASQCPWVRFWGPKIAASPCTHLGPAQVMEVIIIDV